MKKSTKLITTAAASVLGVALAAGGAYAATGSLMTADAPGEVVSVTGVGPASEHASENGLEHANSNAHGLFGWESGHEKDKPGSEEKADDKADRDAAKADRDAAKSENRAPEANDDDDADENESKSHSSGHVEAVEADDAVEVDDDSRGSDDSGGSGKSGKSGKSGD